jgi:hypothetical protein
MTHITIERDKLEQVLEALKIWAKNFPSVIDDLNKQAVSDLEKALAEPTVQPVAWLIPGSITTDPELANANGDKAVALGKISTQQWNPEDHYKDGWRHALESVKRAIPPAAQPAVPLTDEQIEAAVRDWHSSEFHELEDEPSVIDIARAIEAAHGITSRKDTDV